MIQIIAWSRTAVKEVENLFPLGLILVGNVLENCRFSIQPQDVQCSSEY